MFMAKNEGRCAQVLRDARLSNSFDDKRRRVGKVCCRNRSWFPFGGRVESKRSDALDQKILSNEVR